MMKMCLSSCLLLLFITGMCNASIIKTTAAHNATSAVLSPSGGNHPGSGGSGGGGGSSIATGPAKPPASGSGGNGSSKAIVSPPIFSTGTHGNGTMPDGSMSPPVMAHGPYPQCIPTILSGLRFVIFNPNLALIERNQEMDAFVAASKNASVEAVYAQFKANQTECVAEFKAALIHATVSLTPSAQAVAAQLQPIFNNNSLTRMQIMQAVMPIFMNQTNATKTELFKLKSSIYLNNSNCCIPSPGMEAMEGMGDDDNGKGDN